MEPKAKWQRTQAGTWIAQVGPLHLMVSPRYGGCEINAPDPNGLHMAGGTIWEATLPTPCDVTDLMRLTEAELERRLVKAAETMDGGELVAPKPAIDHAKPGSERTVTTTLHASPSGWLVADTSVVAATRVVTLDPATAQGEPWNPSQFHKSAERESPPARCTCYDAVRVRPHGTIVNTCRRHTNTTYPDAKQPRFKVGDLVRVVLSDELRVGKVVDANRVGPEDWWLFQVELQGRNQTLSFNASSMEPYTLPPITSYADLARVLDELPEGVVIEVQPDEALEYRRARSANAARYEFRKPSRFSDWRPSQLHVEMSTPTRETTKFRILNASE